MAAPEWRFYEAEFVKNLLALSTSAVRMSLVLGLSFYPLEQASNMVIYAMSKSGTATSGLI
jgi:hypothetical protein